MGDERKVGRLPSPLPPLPHVCVHDQDPGGRGRVFPSKNAEKGDNDDDDAMLEHMATPSVPFSLKGSFTSSCVKVGYDRAPFWPPPSRRPPPAVLVAVGDAYSQNDVRDGKEEEEG